MRPERLGAFWPGPSSFSRSLLRDLARRGCTVSREHFALDAQGEGFAVYRVMIGGQPFSFGVLSASVPEEEKTDRVIGIKWDVMASLTAGGMTQERLAELRRELPRQKVGRACRNTLVWLRANKSMRAFRHTASRLAQGQEPDPGVLLSTGYLLRTTAFYANGKLGTISFAGLRRLGVLFEPYHAQIMSAWLLREFSFDLVEHLARAGNPKAAPLSREARRMSGVGNSAGVGIVPFILRHPRIIDGWMRANEALLSKVREMTVGKGSAELARFSSLLGRAQIYFSSLPEQDGDYFAPPERIASEFGEVRAALSALMQEASARGKTLAWSRLLDWASLHACAETQEAINVILMELYPALVESAQPLLTVGEEVPLTPQMSLGELGRRIRENYGWVAEVLARNGSSDVFWYRSDEAGEPRIAERGDADWSRREVFMDLALQIDELGRAIGSFPPEMAVADFLLCRPWLYEAARRAQADLRYGEVRANLVDGRLAPLPLIRFVLAFYGMERFTPGSNRWVRGTFLQGAPTAADLAEGVAGEWPFPIGSLTSSVMEKGAGSGGAAFRAEKQNLEADGKRSIEIKPAHGYSLLPLGGSASVRVALPELTHLGELALRSAGMPHGAAQQSGELAAVAQIVAGTGLEALAEALAMGVPQGQGTRGFADLGKVGIAHALSTNGLGLTHFAPYLVAKTLALLDGSRARVLLRIEKAGGGGVLPGLVMELAGRGLLAAAVTGAKSPSASAPQWLSVAAFPSGEGRKRHPTLAVFRAPRPFRALDEIASGHDPSPATFFEMAVRDRDMATHGVCWLWIARSGPWAGELASAASQRSGAPQAAFEHGESLSLRKGSEIAALVAKAERFGLELPRAMLVPVVEAADKMLLAPSEEGAGQGSRTASWGSG